MILTRTSTVVATAVAAIAMVAWAVAAGVNRYMGMAMVKSGGKERVTAEPVLSIYPAPRVIRTAQKFDLRTQVARLAALGYLATEERRPGTYSLRGNELEIRSQFPETGDCRITTNGGVIGKLAALDSAALDECRIEEAPLETLNLSNPDHGWESVHYLPRSWTAFRQTPLVDAVVLRENPEFWTESFPIHDLYRAIYHGGQAGGGSGIFAQLSKNYVLRDGSRAYWRKWKEIGVSEALRSEMTREAALHAYLDKIPIGGHGRPIIGVAAAARVVFGANEPCDLLLHDAATLAILISRPADYLRALRNDSGDAPASVPAKPSRIAAIIPAWLRNLFRPGPKERVTNAELLRRLRSQRDALLDRMRATYPAKYSAEDIEGAKAAPIRIGQKRSDGIFNSAHAGHFLDELKRAGSPVQTGRLYLAMESGIQRIVNATLQEHLKRRAPDFDSKNPRNYQGAIVVMRPDGRVVAMAGGSDTTAGTLNRATQSRRSPGSSLKALLVAFGLDQSRDKFAGAFTVIDSLNDPTADGVRPRKHCGGVGTLYRAVGESWNCPPAIVAGWVGLNRYQEFFKRFLNAEPVASSLMVIGGVRGSEITPLASATAHAALANRGVYFRPRWIGQTVQQGKTIDLGKPDSERMLSPEAAFLGLRLMAAPLESWGTGGSARRSLAIDGRELYLKTGTSQRSDVWTVGILDPREDVGASHQIDGLIIAAWFGLDDNKALSMKQNGFQAARVAVPAFVDLVNGIVRTLPTAPNGKSPAAPPGLKPIAVDRMRGCQSEGPGSTVEYFYLGTVLNQCKDFSVEAKNLRPEPGLGSRTGRPTITPRSLSKSMTKPSPRPAKVPRQHRRR